MIYDDYIIEGYLEEAMSYYDNFHRHYSDGTLHCKCHICGDSKTRNNISRLNAQNYGGTWFVKCYNCGYSGNWLSYLRDYHPSIFESCMTEIKFGEIKKLKDRSEGTKKPEISTKDEVKEEVPIEKNDPKKSIIFPPTVYKISDIQESHSVVQYVKNRKIPRRVWDKLYFTNDFRSLVCMYKEMGDGYSNYKEPRLVIPIFSEDNLIVGFQGRALRKEDEAIKYMTIKVDDNASKLYGLERVDPDKTIFVLEGPLDSLFLSNAIAMTGGSLSLDKMPFPDKRVYVLDIERRHQDTHTRISNLISSGERVVLFDNCQWEGKDINDLLLKNDITVEDIENYMHNNIVSGWEARVRFDRWSKTNERIIKFERKEEKRKRNKDDILNKIKKMGTV